jgi:hypothetical protein
MRDKISAYQKLRFENALLKRELITLSTAKENEFSHVVEQIKLKWRLTADIEKAYWSGEVLPK